jgi:hypothetical protein
MKVMFNSAWVENYRVVNSTNYSDLSPFLKSPAYPEAKEHLSQDLFPETPRLEEIDSLARNLNFMVDEFHREAKENVRNILLGVGRQIDATSDKPQIAEDSVAEYLGTTFVQICGYITAHPESVESYVKGIEPSVKNRGIFRPDGSGDVYITQFWIGRKLLAPQQAELSEWLVSQLRKGLGEVAQYVEVKNEIDRRIVRLREDVGKVVFKIDYGRYDTVCQFCPKE